MLPPEATLVFSPKIDVPVSFSGFAYISPEIVHEIVKLVLSMEMTVEFGCFFLRLPAVEKK